MERGSWSEFAADSEIWQKVAIGAACLLTVLPLPFLFGSIHRDLENEEKKIDAGDKPGAFPGFNDPLGLLGAGLVPCIIFILLLMLLTAPTVVVLVSSGKTYAYFKSEIGLGLFSTVLAAIFGLLAVCVQFLITAMLPIGLAQNARGLTFKTVIDPLANFGYVMQMGNTFWHKAGGMWFFVAGSMLLFVMGWPNYIDLPVRFVLSAIGCTSLMTSSRYALSQLKKNL